MKILIADDHNLFLQGLELVLKNNFPKSEITSCSSYTEIMEILSRNKNFDLIITDLAMPGADSLSGIERINKEVSDIPLVILSAVFDQKIIQKTLDMGVSGYISKASSASEITEAINTVLAGGIYVPKDMLENNEKLFQSLVEKSSETFDSDILSTRQLEVLTLIASGLSNKQIAYELHLSEGTVKFYITAILKKLNVYNRTAAGLKAIELGIVRKKK